MKKIVDQARADPKFFHDLVLNAESVLGKLIDLARSASASLVARQRRVLGTASDCGAG